MLSQFVGPIEMPAAIVLVALVAGAAAVVVVAMLKRPRKVIEAEARAKYGTDLIVSHRRHSDEG